jgi:hypothetical protein
MHIYIYDRGLGLSPSPDPRPNTKIQIQIIFKTIYIKNHMVARWLGGPSQSFPLGGGHGVESCGLHKFYKTNVQVTRGSPLIGPRVTIPFATKHAMCQQCSFIPHCQHLPPAMCRTALPPCHVSYDPATSAYGLYGLYSQHIFFCLFVILNRTRYLSHPTSV